MIYIEKLITNHTNSSNVVTFQLSIEKLELTSRFILVGGNNGSGKSTLFDSLVNLDLNKHVFFDNKSFDEVKHNIFSFKLIELNRNLRVNHYLKIFTSNKNKDLIDSTLFSFLYEILDIATINKRRVIASLTQDEMNKIKLLFITFHSFRYLFFDEVANLFKSYESYLKFLRYIKFDTSFNSVNKQIFLIDHQINVLSKEKLIQELDGLIDTCIILENGRVIENVNFDNSTKVIINDIDKNNITNNFLKVKPNLLIYLDLIKYKVILPVILSFVCLFLSIFSPIYFNSVKSYFTNQVIGLRYDEASQLDLTKLDYDKQFSFNENYFIHSSLFYESKSSSYNFYNSNLILGRMPENEFEVSVSKDMIDKINGIKPVQFKIVGLLKGENKINYSIERENLSSLENVTNNVLKSVSFYFTNDNLKHTNDIHIGNYNSYNFDNSDIEKNSNTDDVFVEDINYVYENGSLTENELNEIKSFLENKSITIKYYENGNPIEKIYKFDSFKLVEFEGSYYGKNYFSFSYSFLDKILLDIYKDKQISLYYSNYNDYQKDLSMLKSLDLSIYTIDDSLDFSNYRKDISSLFLVNFLINTFVTLFNFIYVYLVLFRQNTKDNTKELTLRLISYILIGLNVLNFFVILFTLLFTNLGIILFNLIFNLSLFYILINIVISILFVALDKRRRKNVSIR